MGVASFSALVLIISMLEIRKILNTMYYKSHAISHFLKGLKNSRGASTVTFKGHKNCPESIIS